MLQNSLLEIENNMIYNTMLRACNSQVISHKNGEVIIWK